MHWIDPEGLPAVAGVVERLIANPHGEVDGVLLRDGLLVHVPPHLSEALREGLRPGLAVSVRGVRPRGVPRMLAAVSLEPEEGREIRDMGPPPTDGHRSRPEHVAMAAEGVVRLALHGPKGELRGALLEDGTALRIGPKEASGLAALLRPGARLAVRGRGIDTPEGRVIEVEAAGPDVSSLTPIRRPKEEAKPPAPKAVGARPFPQP